MEFLGRPDVNMASPEQEKPQLTPNSTTATAAASVAALTCHFVCPTPDRGTAVKASTSSDTESTAAAAVISASTNGVSRQESRDTWQPFRGDSSRYLIAAPHSIGQAAPMNL